MNTIRKRIKGYIAFPFSFTGGYYLEDNKTTVFGAYAGCNIFKRKKDAIAYYGTSIPVFKAEILLSRNSKELPEIKVIK